MSETRKSIVLRLTESELKMLAQAMAKTMIFSRSELIRQAIKAYCDQLLNAKK